MPSQHSTAIPLRRFGFDWPLVPPFRSVACVLPRAARLAASFASGRVNGGRRLGARHAPVRHDQKTLTDR
jgi:hypothetical protein